MESSTREGYRFNEGLGAQVEIITKEIPQTPDERCEFIIKKLLFQKKALSFYELETMLYVSPNTIERDIIKIRDLIKSYTGLSLVREENKIFFEGNERDKRLLYRDLLSNEIGENFLNINKVAKLYDRFDLLEIARFLEETLEAYQYNLRETAYLMISVHLGINIERILSGHSLVFSDPFDEDLLQIETKIAEDFFKKVKNRIHLNYKEDEIKALATIIHGYQHSSQLKASVRYHDTEINIFDLMDTITQQLEQIFGLDFKEDEDFMKGLHLHIQTLVMRISNHVIVQNLHLEEVKKSYPLIFEMGLYVGKMIGGTFGFDVSESETGFIALHVGAAYERMTSQKKYQAYLIAPNKSVSKVTKGKIQNMFKDRMEITHVGEFYEEKKVRLANPDLILTLHPIHHDLTIPTIDISLFVSKEDESKIFSTLNELDKSKFAQTFKDEFGGLIDNKYFFKDVKLESKDEVIEFLADTLYRDGIVDENFKRSVFEREAMSSTSFVHALAIPHPLELSSHDSKIAIAILDKPIQWGSYQTKLVMLLAIQEKDNEIMWLFFDWLAEIISDSDRLNQLFASKNRKEFVQRMTKQTEEFK